MTRVALDSNVLLYAELEPESDKGRRAHSVIGRADRDGVVPVQVLGEFLRVVQRKAPFAFARAVERTDIYRAVFLTPATTDAVIVEAARLARTQHLQLWDCVVCAAAASAGATVLLTEDLQDGGAVGGLRLINPFATANQAAVEALLGPELAD